MSSCLTFGLQPHSSSLVRLLPLAELDSQLHPLTVQIADLQMRDFAQTHAGRILEEQKRAMLVTLHTREQSIHFFTTQHRRQLFISAVNATDRDQPLRVSER